MVLQGEWRKNARLGEDTLENAPTGYWETFWSAPNRYWRPFGNAQIVLEAMWALLPKKSGGP